MYGKYSLTKAEIIATHTVKNNSWTLAVDIVWYYLNFVHKFKQHVQEVPEINNAFLKGIHYFSKLFLYTFGNNFVYCVFHKIRLANFWIQPIQCIARKKQHLYCILLLHLFNTRGYHQHGLGSIRASEKYIYLFPRKPGWLINEI